MSLANRLTDLFFWFRCILTFSIFVQNGASAAGDVRALHGEVLKAFVVKVLA